VPPASRASLPLELADKYAYACSFKPDRYLGINVRKPTTLTTRLTGLALATPPTTMILLVYSILLFPLSRAQKISSAGRGLQPGPYVQAAESSPQQGE
jgi:hypothetical protein